MVSQARGTMIDTVVPWNINLYMQFSFDRHRHCTQNMISVKPQ